MLGRKVPVRTKQEVLVIIARNTSANEKPPVPPINPESGEPFPLLMRYRGGWSLCYASDPAECVAALMGDPTYLDPGKSQQDLLVARVKAALAISVRMQSVIVQSSQQNGDWDRLMEAEKQMLLSPRVEQPAGLDEDLFGTPVWTAQVPLVVVTTGYLDRPMPQGEFVWSINPLSNEELLDDLAWHGVIALFRHDATIG